MRKIQGINRDRGYTRLRIWLEQKRNPDGTLNKPFVKFFGPYNKENIERARLFMVDVRERFKAGKPIQKDPRPLSLTMAIDIYWDRHWKREPNRSKKSLGSAKSVLEGFRRYWPSTPIHLVKPRDIEDYIAVRQRSGVKNSTIKQQLNLLGSMFERINEYLKRGEIDPVVLPDCNPVQYAKKPKMTTNMKRNRWATREELKKIKMWCLANDADLWRAIEYAILTGLRHGDLMSLQGQKRVFGASQKTGSLISTPVSFAHPASMTNYRRRWVRARKAVGMEDFHWHDFRHTHATMLKNLAAPNELIQESLGHSDPKQTEIYTNAKAERLSPWVDKLRSELDSIDAA